MPSATKKEVEFHNLIIARNDIAFSQLFDIYGESVINKLKKWYPDVASTDYSLIISAVHDAFLGYHQNPATFNPSLNSLLRFLEIAAERDLLNTLQKEKKLPETVELLENNGNSSVGTQANPENELIKEEKLNQLNLLLQQYFLNKTDIEIVKLILLKERQNWVFADILCISGLSTEEQASIIKRNKDRIKKVLERNDLENKIKGLLL